MHEGDPRGQLRENRRDAELCTHCHQALAPRAEQVAHARHGAEPPSCVACHMPSIVYGVLSAHPSHRIEVPDPARAAERKRPDACTLCHTDRDRGWAIREAARLYGLPAPSLPDGSTWSELETQLIAGDPIERALAAEALGGHPAAPAVRSRQSTLLLEALEHDPYPAVRRFAARALAQVHPSLSAELANFVPESTPAERRGFVAVLRQHSALPQPAAEVLRALRAQAQERAIVIGE
jgi:hypothetical protein